MTAKQFLVELTNKKLAIWWGPYIYLMVENGRLPERHDMNGTVNTHINPQRFMYTLIEKGFIKASVKTSGYSAYQITDAGKAYLA